jgi:2-hydroxy-3-keto-5-methylthiopentenyl-1-phosphate phosphatase
MRSQPSVLVLDFDGTLTTADVGDAVCARFAPPSWRAIDERWVRHEISLPDAQREMWALVRAHKEEAIAFVQAHIELRPGLDALLDGAAARGMPVWLASGGFDFYIDALLGERRARFARLLYSATLWQGDRGAVQFPHAQLACARCAVCKGVVCDLARRAGAAPLFVGDGHSDRCVVGRAERVAAVRGSTLARHLAAHDAPCLEFERLDELVDWLV